MVEHSKSQRVQSRKTVNTWKTLAKNESSLAPPFRQFHPVAHVSMRRTPARTLFEKAKFWICKYSNAFHMEIEPLLFRLRKHLMRHGRNCCLFLGPDVSHGKMMSAYQSNTDHVVADVLTPVTESRFLTSWAKNTRGEFYRSRNAQQRSFLWFRVSPHNEQKTWIVSHTPEDQHDNCKLQNTLCSGTDVPTTRFLAKTIYKNNLHKKNRCGTRKLYLAYPQPKNVFCFCVLNTPNIVFA